MVRPNEGNETKYHHDLYLNTLSTFHDEPPFINLLHQLDVQSDHFVQYEYNINDKNYQ